MFEIELPLESGGVSYMDDDSCHIGPDILICARPGQLRHTMFPHICYYVHLIIEDGALYNMMMSVPSFIKVDDHNRYSELLRRISKYHNSTVERDLVMAESLILELIYTISKDAETMLLGDGVRGDKHDVIKSTIKYIKENLTSDLSLETVAAHSGFSPIYFHNFFKKATGKTLRDYVEEQRIRRAANMIVSSDMTLTRIAYECGFSSQSYFSYAFKRRIGMTPREYAKKIFEQYEG